MILADAVNGSYLIIVVIAIVVIVAVMLRQFSKRKKD